MSSILLWLGPLAACTGEAMIPHPFRGNQTRNELPEHVMDRIASSAVRQSAVDCHPYKPVHS